MLGTRIKQLRTAHHLNQIEFGQKLSVTKQSVSNWENGNILPSVDMLVKIAALFSVSADYLLGIDGKLTLDVSDLTEEQIALLRSLIQEFQKK